MSAYDALMKYSKKTAKMPGQRGKSGKPEKAVVLSMMEWLNTNGFSCHVVESKAVYSRSAGRYLSGQTDAGFSDIVGCDPEGMAVFIEAKAKGRRNTLKAHQRIFLEDKLSKGAFAVCADSVEYLIEVYDKWLEKGYSDRQLYLLDCLPKHRQAQNVESP